jgi:hypothetical protein
MAYSFLNCKEALTTHIIISTIICMHCHRVLTALNVLGAPPDFASLPARAVSHAVKAAFLGLLSPQLPFSFMFPHNLNKNCLIIPGPLAITIAPTAGLGWHGGEEICGFAEEME